MNMAETPNTPLRTSLTLSVVSHGHGLLLQQMLSDLNGLPDIAGTKVVVTLNLSSEAFDPTPYDALQLVVVRNQRPRGFGANHNHAFTTCDTPWFAILNPDLRFTQSDCFARLLAAASDRPGLALLAPVITNSSGAVEDAVRSNLTPLSVLRRRRLASTHAERYDTFTPLHPGKPFYWLAGMFLVVRASAFAAVGGFDERFFLYCEDYDLSARLFNAGHTLMQVPTAHALHDARRDSRRSLRHLRLHIASLAKVWSSGAFWRIWWHDLRTPACAAPYRKST